MTRTALIPSLFASLFAGCAVEPSAQKAPIGDPQAVVMTAPTAKGDQLYSPDYPTLLFSKEGEVTLTQTLHVDDLLSVRYDPARLTACELKSGSLRSITGYYQIDERPPVSIEYTPTYSSAQRIQEAMIKVPAGEKLMFWFYSVDSDGCETWDSNFGHNYLVPVSPMATEQDEPARLTFHTSGEVSQEGTLSARGQLTLQYDPTQLNECESSQNGHPQWGITGHFKTDQSEVQRFQATQSVEGELQGLEVTIDLPAGELLSLWFTATNRYGCFQESELWTFELQ